MGRSTRGPHNDSRYSSAQKQALQVQLANLMLQKPYSKYQTAYVLLACACQEATPMPSFIQGGALKRTFENHSQNHRSEFLKELQEDPAFATNVMNLITNTLLNREAPSWKLASYPNFVNEDDSMTVNLLTGQTRCQNSANSPLPQNLLKWPEYKEIFGNQNFSAKVENCNVFTFTKDNLLYRIEVDGAETINSTIIDVQIDEKWYRHIPKAHIDNNLLIKPPLKEG